MAKFFNWLCEYCNKKLGLSVEFGEADIPNIKLLLEKHLPILVYQLSTPERKRPHFRVVIGYDDAQEIFITHDPAPQLGKDYKISYQEFENLWHLSWYSDEKGKKVRFYFAITGSK